MLALYTFKQFQLYKLDVALATQYAQEICQSQDQIPLTAKHTPDQLLAITKGERQLHHKFDHSLIALSGDAYAGVIIGYERPAEPNLHFPKNSINLKSLAVSSEFQKQGLGKFLVDSWLDYNQQVGFLELTGGLCFSVQTNSAGWNAHVQGLYTSAGFQKTSEKEYENRVDTVYFLGNPPSGD